MALTGQQKPIKMCNTATDRLCQQRSVVKSVPIRRYGPGYNADDTTRSGWVVALEAGWAPRHHEGVILTTSQSVATSGRAVAPPLEPA
jgi:hypothetical protein